MLELKDICIWRYLVSDEVEEGTPPKWLIDMIRNFDGDTFLNIKKENIFYIKSKDGNPENDYKYYPFR